MKHLLKLTKVSIVLIIMTLSKLSAQTIDDTWKILGNPSGSNPETITAATINTALASGKIVSFVANKEYDVTGGTIEIEGGETLHVPASVKLNFSSSTATAIKLFGEQLYSLAGLNGSALIGEGGIFYSDSGCGVNNVGVMVMGASSKVELGEISNFGVGIKLLGDDAHNSSGSGNYSKGTVYNNIKVGLIRKCKIGVELAVENLGWTNQNYIHINNINGLDSCSDWGIYIDSNGGTFSNGNKSAPNQNFFSGGIEGAMQLGAVYIGGGQTNSFYGLRFEISNSNYFQLEQSSNQITPLNNFGYANSNGTIVWGTNVTGSALNRNALLFYGAKQSDLYVSDNSNLLTSNSSKIGVGTDSPNATIDIHRTVSGVPLAIFDNGNTDSSRLNIKAQDDAFDFITEINSGVEPFLHFGNETDGRVLTVSPWSDGRVGINSSTPLSTFEVNGGTTETLPIASFYHDKEGINTSNKTRLNINGSSGHMELLATYFSGGASLHLGNAQVNRAITILNGTGNVGIHKDPQSSYKLDVNGDVYGNAFYIPGGGPLDFTDTSEIINHEVYDKLLNLKTTKVIESIDENIASSPESDGNDKKKSQYLFDVDELKEHFPELLKVDAESETIGVDYISFIPLMIRKIQEQEKKIEQLETILLGGNNDIATSDDANHHNSGAKLYQNIPNPNSIEASIKVFLPDGINKAKLIFFDLQGKTLKEVIINEKGEQELKILSSEFSSGMYLYSLVVDGHLVDTKRMIIDN